MIIDNETKETFKQPLAKCRLEDLTYQSIRGIKMYAFIQDDTFLRGDFTSQGQECYSALLTNLCFRASSS